MTIFLFMNEDDQIAVHGLLLHSRRQTLIDLAFVSDDEQSWEVPAFAVRN